MGGTARWPYSEEGPGRAAAPPSPLLTVPNVTAHPSTASVPTLYIQYGTIIVTLHSKELRMTDNST